MIERLALSYPVPYCAQVASPDLAERIFTGKLDARDDPRWAETGASTPEEYAHWTQRACGAACVKMVVDALGGTPRSLMDTIRAGQALGGYLTEKAGAGRTVERGWLHRALADIIRSDGFWAEAQPAGLEEIALHLRGGRMVIASVSYEIGAGLPITRKNGHLVVVTGIEYEDLQPAQVILNNPSGRRLHLQAGALIPLERFLDAFSGRIIAAGAAPPCKVSLFGTLPRQ